jgi:acyl carrier protein
MAGGDGRSLGGAMPLSVEEKIRQIIAFEMCIDESEVTPSSRIIEDLNGDSLDIVELVMQIEGEFSIEIGDDDAETLTTVGQVIEYVNGRI